MANYAVAQFNLPTVDGEQATKTRNTKVKSSANKKTQNKRLAIQPKIISSAVISSIQLANSAIGSYTGNKVRQANVSTGLGIVGIGVGALFNPSVAAITAVGLLTKTYVGIQVQQINSTQETRYRRSNLGNMTSSGSRWRGGQ